MAGLITIKLQNLIFFGRHGIYEEEKSLGNEFELNLAISFVSSEKIIGDINHTINYETVYELVKQEMGKPSPLLETLVTRITEILHSFFPGIKKITISICKLHPPIEGFIGKAGVSYEKEF